MRSPALNHPSSPPALRYGRYPVGAQTERQRAAADARYEEGKANYESSPEGGLKPYHHGSHYSCEGFVVWYLMRLEPFTSLHCELQGGSFDLPDRLFGGVAAAWQSCLENRCAHTTPAVAFATHRPV